MDAKDVIDIQVTVASLDVADEINDALANVGYPRIEHITADFPHTDDPALWRKRIHCARRSGAGRRTFMSESTVGQVSSSHCCSGTG